MGEPGHGLLPDWISPPPEEANKVVADFVHASSVVTRPPAGRDMNVFAGGG